MHKLFYCGLHSAVHSKRLKKKRKKQRHTSRVNFFSCMKNIKKGKNLRVLGLSERIYPKALGLDAMLDPRVIL